MRINVIGCSGSGKSTFSKQLADNLAIRYVEMDALHWKANWTAASDDELIASLNTTLRPDSWVLDGNYHRTIDIKWNKVQTVIFLDLPFPLVLYRIIKRSLITRGLLGQRLWAGNTESIWKHLFSRDSMILWVVKTYHTHNRRFIAYKSNPRYEHINFVRLSSRKQVREYLAG